MEIKMKKKIKCNEVVYTETIKIPARKIKVEYKALHGNCDYVGCWECTKNLITISAYLSPEQIMLVREHEWFHTALCTFIQALGLCRPAAPLPLCRVSNCQDTDPLLRLLLIDDYKVGYRERRYGFYEVAWRVLKWASRKLAGRMLDS